MLMLLMLMLIMRLFTKRYETRRKIFFICWLSYLTVKYQTTIFGDTSWIKIIDHWQEIVRYVLAEEHIL